MVEITTQLLDRRAKENRLSAASRRAMIKLSHLIMHGNYSMADFSTWTALFTVIFSAIAAFSTFVTAYIMFREYRGSNHISFDVVRQSEDGGSTFVVTCGPLRYKAYRVDSVHLVDDGQTCFGKHVNVDEDYGVRGLRPDNEAPSSKDIALRVPPASVPADKRWFTISLCNLNPLSSIDVMVSMESQWSSQSRSIRINLYKI